MPKTKSAIKGGAMFSRDSSGYIATLDGWRAIAIFGVIFHHTYRDAPANSLLHTLQDLGATGVELFFAISGILVCSRLLDEETKRGSILLKKFFLRRLFRIQPAALTYLITLVALAVFGLVPFSKSTWLAALFSLRNFDFWNTGSRGGWYTGHFWSLAIEEHFYLLLPWLLILLKRRHRLRFFVIISVVSIGIYEIANRNPGSKPAWYSELELCWLFAPACLALLLRRDSFRTNFRRFFPATPTFCAVALLLTGMIFGVRHIQHLYLPSLSILVMATTLHPGSLIGRMLELPPLRAIGRLSYSLYLWQQLFCISERHFERAHPPMAWLQHFPQSWICAAVCAFLSYWLIEKPFIKLGHRIATPVTAGHQDFSVSQLESTTARSVEIE